MLSERGERPMIPSPEAIRLCEQIPDNEILNRIAGYRKHWGKSLVILAHLYQRRDIAKLADFVGDSYGLSKSAAHVEDGRFIVFCGVRFMAESAAILCRKDQVVLHPEPEAGCPMADMAALPDVKQAWSVLTSIDPSVIPVTYMNSTADIKAFCGEQRGTICTSSNALKTFQWAFQEGKKIFFLPDEHLGRNTAIQ